MRTAEQPGGPLRIVIRNALQPWNWHTGPLPVPRVPRNIPTASRGVVGQGSSPSTLTAVYSLESGAHGRAGLHPSTGAQSCGQRLGQTGWLIAWVDARWRSKVQSPPDLGFGGWWGTESGSDQRVHVGGGPGPGPRAGGCSPSHRRPSTERPLLIGLGASAGPWLLWK